MTAVEWLISQYIKDGVLDKKVYEQALEMEKQQKIEFGKKVADHWGMTEVPIQEIEKFLNETYGSKGSDELGSSLEWNGELTNGNNVEKVPNVTSSSNNFCVCLISNCYLINSTYVCSTCNKPLLRPFSMYEHKETITSADTPTSSQTEISEHRFTEKDIRFAYMQGYNRGVDGNPNHMESYIEHLKSTKTSQTEISDEEIMEAAYKYAEVYQCPTEIKMCKHDVISAWNNSIGWYREQLKKKQ